MSLSTCYLEDGRHVARLRRRAYAPMSNTAAHDDHKKINSWVSFFLYGYGLRLVINVKDKLDISKIIDRYLHMWISYCFYQFVSTRYTTDFYIIINNLLIIH